MVNTEEGSATDAQTHYGCLGDNVLVGANVSTCLENGTWDNPVPFCQDVITWTKGTGVRGCRFLGKATWTSDTWV